MYCPNCGTKLENLDQRFCQECGVKIPDNSEPAVVEAKTSMSEYAVPRTTGSIPLPTQYASLAKPTPSPGAYDIEYSKKALGFGLPAFLMALIAFIVISPLMIFPYGSTIIIIPVVLGIHGVGLLFAILGTVFGSKAAEFEPDNGMQKAGMVFAIIGIIINTLALLGLLGRAPSLLFSYYYY